MPSRFLPPATLAAGSIAVLVGFGGTIALVIGAAQASGAAPAQITSWVTALCLGTALAGLVLSLVLRLPIVCAWSTPGAALILTTAPGLAAHGIGYPGIVGAFVVAAALMLLVGLIPALGRLIGRIPVAIASAMLAGVLAPFCFAIFTSAQADLLFAGVLLLVFIIARRLVPAYALLLVLAAGIALLLLRGQSGDLGGIVAPRLAPVVPQFGWQAAISLGVPLFLVTLVSQNLPGLAVLRAAGYDPPARPLLLVTSIVWLALAPLGAHGVNLAAITAALCTGEDAHPDPGRRYLAGLVYGFGYVLMALFAAPLVSLFMQLPAGAVLTIAGIALIGPLTGALGGALAVPAHREAAMLTFIATASGFSLLGIGAAFWGLVAGLAALAIGRLLGPRAGRA